MIKKVILVFKTHFDIGFTELSEKVLQDYAGPMLRDVLATCRQTAHMGNQKFVWTMPSWPLRTILERAKGAEKQELEEMIRQRRIVWHALPYTSHTDFCSPQELIYGLRYARELSQEFGIPPVVSAKMSDVPGHGRILPEILAGGGIKFLHLGCNEYATSPNFPTLFHWQAPSGVRVLTMYSPHGYGSSITPPEDWNLPVWMAFMHTHDNMGPQTAESIAEIVAQVQKELPGAEVVTGTMDDFYAELAQLELSHLPVVEKDPADSWIHGVGSYPKEVAVVREARTTALAAEKALALTAAQMREECASLLADTYDNLTLFGEHTWGLDVKTWMGSDRVYSKPEFRALRSSQQYRYMEESWEEQRTRARAAEKSSRKALSCLQQQGKSGILNPSAGDFSGWAVADNNAPSTTLPKLSVFGKLHIYVKDVPALSVQAQDEAAFAGWMRMPLIQKETSDGVVVQNHRYRLVFQPQSGKILSLYDKKLQAPLLKAQGETGVFSYRYDKYGSGNVEEFLQDYCSIDSDWGIKDNGRENYPQTPREVFSPVFNGWSIQDSTVMFHYKGTGCADYGDAEGILLCVTLPPVGDEVFVELKLKSKHATPFIESGSLVLPLAHQQPIYRLNKNGEVLDPKTDILTGANHAFYCLEAFVSAQQGNAALCVVTHDTPLLSIGETGVYTFRREYEEHEPQLFFNLFNNMWGTNFPQWTEGDFSFRYTLFGHSANEPAAARALQLWEGARILPLEAAGCPVQLPQQVAVVNLQATDKGKLLTLRDVSGTGRRISVCTRNKNGSLVQADLLGNPTGQRTTGKLSLELGAYGFCAILLP